MKNKELVGTIINGLKVINYLSKGKRQFFECYCVCGKLFQARVDSIKVGTTKSCGCVSGELIAQKTRLPNNQGAINLVYRHYRNNAKKRKLSFQLTIEDIEKLIFCNCVYCGCEPQLSVFTSSTKNRKDKQISYNGIDRIDNSIGYVIDNCVTCCAICNMAKLDRSALEFKIWIERIVKFNVK